MKKTIMLFLGMILLLNGVDLKSSENNKSSKGGEYLYKISKEVSLKKLTFPTLNYEKKYLTKP